MLGGVIESRPIVYLLVGLPGSGKTTYAKALQWPGVVGLSVDAQLIARHGRIGKDYPESAHLALLRPIVEEVPVERAELLRRLAIRNSEAKSGLISAETLDWIAEHSEEPVGEGEELPDIGLR